MRTNPASITDRIVDDWHEMRSALQSTTDCLASALRRLELHDEKARPVKSWRVHRRASALLARTAEAIRPEATDD